MSDDSRTAFVVVLGKNAAHENEHENDKFCP
jgi:hypothetical protein